MWNSNAKVSFLKRSSGKVVKSTFALSKLSRGDAYECFWPSVENWSAKGARNYEEKMTVINPHNVSAIPSISQLREWRRSIDALETSHHQWKCIETSKGRLDVDGVNKLMQFHTARNIQAAVEEEIAWFSRPYNKPETVCDHPTDESIKSFHKLLYNTPYSQINKDCGLSSNEISMLCANRWVSSDHMCWLVENLNRMETQTYYVYLNGAILHPASQNRFKKCEVKPSKICFAINVKKEKNGNTFMGSDSQPGNHWTMCFVDTNEKTIIYGDSLGWKVPHNLLSIVEMYIKAVDDNDIIENYSVTVAHDPDGKCSNKGGHKCTNRCCRTYPFQTCADVCGVVVMLMMAISCHNYEFFKMIVSRSEFTSEFPPVYLSNPTRYSKYLRLVLGCWIADNSVNIDYVVPQFWSATSQPQNPHDVSSNDNDATKTSPDTNCYKDKNVPTLCTPLPCDVKKSMQKASDLNMKNEKNKVDAANKKQFKCPECHVVFTRSFNLNRHVQRVHTDKQNGNCKCQFCQFRCKQITMLQDHLGKEHGMVFHTETVLLDNMSAFKEWKDKIEEDNICSYTQRNGEKNNVLYFKCNRGGVYNPQGTGKRRTKAQGTCKIQENCTSGIKVTKRSDGSVLAEICYTHHGHEKEVQHTWLSKGKREEIAARIQQGVSCERVLNDIRDDATQQNNLEFKRHHLLEKKDINNIKTSFGLNDIQKHSDDQTSVRAWVQEWNDSEHNPILFTKFQGDDAPDNSNLTKDDFILVIQNPLQKHMAQKFSGKGVCIDATHGTTGYDFYLTSLVVLDEFGSGFPVAWCLSNHEDFTHMCVFFESIKKNCGVLQPKWLMSDLASQYYNAWVAIMGGGPKRLYCTWHVDRAWQEELRAKVKDTLMAAEIYKMLRVVLQQTDESSFEKCMEQLLKKLPLMNKEFYSYFQREWSGRAKFWAYCYRRGMGINTNMAVEAFHRVFKYNYLKGKTNKRVDNCLISLRQFIRDKSFERAIKLSKGKATYRTKLIQDRHRKSKELSLDCIKGDGTSRWKVMTESENTYTVIRQVNHCVESSCQIRCHECNICIHQYICDCPDSQIHDTICKHIHLLIKYLCVKEDNNSKEDQVKGYNESEMQVLASQILCEKPQEELDSTRSREAVKKQLLNLLNLLNDSEDNTEAMQVLNRKIAAAKNLFVTMKENACQSHLKPVNRSPANKCIEPQRKFKSTKKKRKRGSKVRFAKPTQDDMENLFQGENKDLVREQLEGFGVLEDDINKAIASKKLLTTDDIHLDEEHPPAEALGYAMHYVKPYLAQCAWKKISLALHSLQNEWRCYVCEHAKLGSMIMCDFCSTWNHWDCIKIKDEDDEWFCQSCENLNNCD